MPSTLKRVFDAAVYITSTEFTVTVNVSLKLSTDAITPVSALRSRTSIRLQSIFAICERVTSVFGEKTGCPDTVVPIPCIMPSPFTYSTYALAESGISTVSAYDEETKVFF